VVAIDGKPVTSDSQCSISDPYDARDPRPIVMPTEFMPMVLGTAVGVALFMAGRAARYVASGE
jgi:hypothetical protein